MYLAPHHFQAQRRHFDDAVALTLSTLFAFAYGVVSAALDEEALRNGTLALLHARGILPDGTPFSIPDGDAAPAPSRLADRFSPTRDGHVVHLALPAWQRDGANVRGVDAGGAGDAEAPAAWASPLEASGDPRFVAVAHEVVDEVSGQERSSIPFAAKNLRLALDDELVPGDVTLPVAWVRRDGAGHFVVDADVHAAVPAHQRQRAAAHAAAADWSGCSTPRAPRSPRRSPRRARPHRPVRLRGQRGRHPLAPPCRAVGRDARCGIC